METVAGKDLLRGHGMTPLLEVQDLHVSYGAEREQSCVALAGVNLRLLAGETLGVLGESGSGKSTLAAALLRMLPSHGRIDRGAVRFAGRELLPCDARDMEKIRGGRMALIFQEPSLVLHPALRVAEQVRDVIAAHSSLRRGELRERTGRVLAAVFPTETERIAQSYPHQLSGGQRARVLIAQAICCEPALILADEPTASLDAETEQDILLLFRRLREEFKLSLIWITHNPALLAGFADRVMVLYAGRVVEVGPTTNVLSSPRHPYTQALLRCLPPGLSDGRSGRRTELVVIPGETPRTVLNVGRCVFEPRCSERMDVCLSGEPELVRVRGEHLVSCVKYVGCV
jgi:oligopeptide/dipeptide ABC transporter ATP-binding protein